MIIDFIEYLGQVKNDTDILGKAFIFNIIDETNIGTYTFDCILFVHKTVPAFISLAEEDLKYNKDKILNKIFEKYTLDQLLEA